MNWIIAIAVVAGCLATIGMVAGMIADVEEIGTIDRMEARIRAIEIKLGEGGWLDRPAMTADLGGDEVR